MYIIPKYFKKEIEKYTTFSGTEKNTTSQDLCQLSIWRGALGTLGIDNQLNSLKVNGFKG